MRNVVNDQIERLEVLATDGYVKKGRGMLAIEFYYDGGWQAAFLYKSLAELPQILKPEAIAELRRYIETYDPDKEAVFGMAVAGDTGGFGVLEFYPETEIET